MSPRFLPSRLRFLLFLGLLVFCFSSVSAQDARRDEDLDWDLDTIFDEPEEVPDLPGGTGAAPGKDGDAPSGGAKDADQDSGLSALLRRSGFSLDLSYSANGGFSPGWSESPWFAGEYEPKYNHVFGANLNSYLSMDVRVSEVFRARSSFSFSVPGVSFNLVELFFDYHIQDRVYFRVGKFSYNWGISPNFPSANLLSRLPQGNSGGDPYILKVDIPVDIGGLQFLALTRPGFISGTTPGFNEIGYGAKHNLAFTWADIDLAFFYHREMPLRGSVSVKTTVQETELYFETMGAIRNDTWDKFGFSVTLGFVQSFLSDLVSVNAEIFWNGEDNAYYYKPKSEIEDEKSSPFIAGLNTAWNLVFRPRLPRNLRFALAGRWALETNTAYLLPGLSFSPLSHIDVSLGFPIALGGRGGHYYRNNADKDGRPVGIALLINLHGSFYRDFY
jgi:hypothetical protein